MDFQEGYFFLDSIKRDGNKLAITIEDIDVNVFSLSTIYKFTKDSKISLIIMSGLSYQSGTYALVSVETSR